MDTVRIDKWLWAARFFKTRALAQKACAGGHVKVGGRNAKPAHPLRIGDEVQAMAPRGPVVAVVLALAEKRLSAPLAAELYEDHSPPPPPPEVIEIVEYEVEIEDDVVIDDTESDEDEMIEIEDESDDEFFMVVENMPEFPGGDLWLMKYIQKNVKYPPIAKEYNITGKVYVSFIVDKSGAVTNVKVVRGVDKNLDAEAVRVVKSLPKYKAGKQRGKPVRVMFTIPINFTLS